MPQASERSEKIYHCPECASSGEGEEKRRCSFGEGSREDDEIGDASTTTGKNPGTPQRSQAKFNE